MPTKKRAARKKDTSPYVCQKKKKDIHFSTETSIPWTDKQHEFLKLIQDKHTKVIFLSGVAGTSKTLISVYAGLLALAEKKVSDIVYIRSAVESASSKLGFLPGELDDKFGPYLEPLADKLDELLGPDVTKILMQNEMVSARPINYLRGCQFAGKFVIADEAQNFTISELTTLVTRIGEFSKVIICGDPMQSDIGSNSGFSKFVNVFDNSESSIAGIEVFRFGEEDIVRSKILKFIVEKLKVFEKK